jgi:hypothetical protein
MGKLEYCSNLDHAQYLVPDASQGIKIGKEVLDSHGRYHIRIWIENNCIGTVYVCIGTKTPTFGQTDWTDLVSPSGVGIFFFENIHDLTLFQMVWA